MFLIDFICELIMGTVYTLLYCVKLMTLFLVITFALGAVWREADRRIHEKQKRDTGIAAQDHGAVQ